jgi:chitosanase
LPIRLKLLALIATATTLVLAAGASPLAAQSTTGWLTAEQKTRADALISVFENDTPVIQYDFHEILGDGRGITMGRGFTTATGDVLQVIKLYSTRVPASRLATYIPVLEQLEAEGIPSDDSRVPAALGDDWAATARSDPAFRTAEDEVNDENAYRTAMQLADAQFGASLSALGRVILYDTVFMQGDGPDPDSASALIAQTVTTIGKPGAGTDAKRWWTAFLNIRRADLLNPANPYTKAEWSKSTGRIAALQALVRADNWDFAGPLDVGEGDWTPVTIP